MISACYSGMVAAWRGAGGGSGINSSAAQRRREVGVGLFDQVVIGVLPLVPKPVVGYFSKPEEN